MIKWKKDALDHAKECDPSESCGLLVKIKNKNKYWACKNICTNNIDCFVIDPNDWIGKTITLYPTTCRFGKDPAHPCIRVKI